MGKQTTVAGNWARSIGFTLSMLAVLFLVFDSAIKMLQMAPAIEATTQLGYPEYLVLWIGVLEVLRTRRDFADRLSRRRDRHPGPGRFTAVFGRLPGDRRLIGLGRAVSSRFSTA